MNVQFKKGALDLCVMALLNIRDCYGFELASAVSRHVDISEGTVYPLLRRLKDENLLDTYLVESSGGPPRKYYTLTMNGRTYFEEMEKQWRSFTRGVDTILEGQVQL